MCFQVLRLSFSRRLRFPSKSPALRTWRGWTRHHDGPEACRVMDCEHDTLELARTRHSPTPRLLQLLALELPPVLWLLWPYSVGPKHRRETGKQTSLYYLLIVYILNHSNTCLIEFNRVSMFVFVYDIFIIDLLEVFDDAKSTLQEFGALRCKCPRAFSADLGKTSLKIVCSSDSCTTLHSLAQNGVAGWPFMEFSRPGNILNLPVASSGSLRHASSSSQS